MNTLQKKLAASSLLTALARAIHNTGNEETLYIRLRIDAHRFTSCSPEIGYLDHKSEARYVAPSINGADSARIVALADKLARAHTPSEANEDTDGLSLELEAVEVGRRWCLSIKVTKWIPRTSRLAERHFQYWIPCADRSRDRLAA